METSFTGPYCLVPPYIWSLYTVTFPLSLYVKCLSWVLLFLHLPCFIAYIWCDSHTLTHSERLSISVEPQQKVVNASDRAELTCTASSYPPPTIVWTREVSTELQLQAGVIDDKQGSLPIPTFLAALYMLLYILSWDTLFLKSFNTVVNNYETNVVDFAYLLLHKTLPMNGFLSQRS